MELLCSRCGVGPVILHLKQDTERCQCCWSTDHFCVVMSWSLLFCDSVTGIEHKTQVHIFYLSSSLVWLIMYPILIPASLSWVLPRRIYVYITKTNYFVITLYFLKQISMLSQFDSRMPAFSGPLRMCNGGLLYLILDPNSKH